MFKNLVILWALLDFALCLALGVFLSKQGPEVRSRVADKGHASPIEMEPLRAIISTITWAYLEEILFRWLMIGLPLHYFHSKGWVVFFISLSCALFIGGEFLSRVLGSGTEPHILGLLAITWGGLLYTATYLNFGLFFGGLVHSLHNGLFMFPATLVNQAKKRKRQETTKNFLLGLSFAK